MSGLSIIIPAHNAAHYLPRCLEALRKSETQPREVIVVDDCSDDGSGSLAEANDARVLRLEARSGAGAARNVGAAQAQGDVFVFVDADVCIHPDALTRVAQRLDEEPDLWAVIGAYDAAPAADSLVSRFRNLFHAYTHWTGGRRTRTFWTGLGAVRAAAFKRVGGFPSVTLEDVAFGARLAVGGGTIALEPAIRGTHLKRWTLASAITTDVWRRGAPWVRMALSGVDMGDNLNTRGSQRWSVALAGAFLALLAAAFALHGMAAAAPFACVLAALSLPGWPDADSSRPVLRAGVLFALFGLGGAALMTLALPLYAAAIYLVAALLAAVSTALSRKRPRRRASLGAATVLAVLAMVASFPLDPVFVAIGAIAAVYVGLNLGFLRFVAQHAGIADAIGSAPLLFVYHVCCGVSVLVGVAIHGLAGGAPPSGLAGESTPSR